MLLEQGQAEGFSSCLALGLMARSTFWWCGGQADAMRGNIAAVPLPEESSEAGCLGVWNGQCMIHPASGWGRSWRWPERRKLASILLNMFNLLWSKLTFQDASRPYLEERCRHPVRGWHQTLGCPGSSVGNAFLRSSSRSGRSTSSEDPKPPGQDHSLRWRQRLWLWWTTEVWTLDSFWLEPLHSPWFSVDTFFPGFGGPAMGQNAGQEGDPLYLQWSSGATPYCWWSKVVHFFATLFQAKQLENGQPWLLQCPLCRLVLYHVHKEICLSD